MRGIYVLLGMLMAIPAGTVHAGGTDSCRNGAVAEARLVCRIKIRVTVGGGGACTATAPATIDVGRNPDGHPVFMLFFIKDAENNANLRFDATDGVRLVGNGTGGTQPDQVFERQSQDRRIFLVRNKNPSNEDFNYEINVWNGGTKCTSADPLIHNRN